MQQHLIISEPPKFYIREDAFDEGVESDEIQNDDNDDDEDNYNDMSFPTFRLSPPCSSLAKRRHQPLEARISVGSSGFESGGSLPNSQSSTGGIMF